MDNSSLKEILPTLPWLRVVHYLLNVADGKHVAHCLDLDLVSVGATRDDAVRKLDDLVKTQIELSLGTGRLVNLTTKAPVSFWRQYFDCKPVELEPRSIHITIPDMLPIDSADSEIGILARAA